MKFIVCVVAAFAALQYVSCYMPTDDSQELAQKINMKLLRDSIRQQAALEQAKTKLETICPGYGNQLENVTMEVASCVEDIDDTQETMCSMIKNHYRKCVRPINDLLEECLPSQSRQIPELVTKAIIAVTNHLCKTDGEHIFELGNSCIKNITPKTQRCVRQMTAKYQQYRDKRTSPSALNVCDSLEALRPCFQSHLNSACGHPITRQSFLDLFDEVTKVCKPYKENEIEIVDIEAK